MAINAWKPQALCQVTYPTLLTRAVFEGDELPFGNVCLPPFTEHQAQMANFGWPIRQEESQS